MSIFRFLLRLKYWPIYVAIAAIVLVVVIVCFLVGGSHTTDREKEAKKALKSDGAKWFKHYILKHFKGEIRFSAKDHYTYNTCVEDGVGIKYSIKTETISFFINCGGYLMDQSEEYYKNELAKCFNGYKAGLQCNFEILVRDDVLSRIVVSIPRPVAESLNLNRVYTIVRGFAQRAGYERLVKSFSFPLTPTAKSLLQNTVSAHSKAVVVEFSNDDTTITLWIPRNNKSVKKALGSFLDIFTASKANM